MSVSDEFLFFRLLLGDSYLFPEPLFVLEPALQNSFCLADGELGALRELLSVALKKGDAVHHKLHFLFFPKNA